MAETEYEGVRKIPVVAVSGILLDDAVWER